MKEPQPVDTGLIPDPAYDSKTFKKLLMDRVRARGGTASVDTKQLFQSLVKETIEAFLELEMEEHLGYAKHDPEGRGTGNSRGDGLAGLRSAVESVFPQTDVQLCVVHHIRNVTKFVSWKDRRQLCADMRPIYRAHQRSCRLRSP